MRKSKDKPLSTPENVKKIKQDEIVKKRSAGNETDAIMEKSDYHDSISGGSRPGHKVSGTRSKFPNLNENGQKSHFLRVFSDSGPGQYFVLDPPLSMNAENHEKYLRRFVHY